MMTRRKNRKNRRSKTFKEKIMDLSLSAWILIAALIYFLIFSLNITIENIQLKKDGVYTRACVIGYGRRFSRYEFKVGLRYYRGTGGPGYLDIGDSLTVVYLPSDPTVNRSRE